MNTLLFFCGVGVGILAACILFILVVNVLWRQTKAQREDSKLVLELMKERNAHSAQTNRYMLEVANYCMAQRGR